MNKIQQAPLLRYDHFNTLSSTVVIKDIFINPEMLLKAYWTSGFSINQLTVKFSYRKNECEITFFEKSGKLHTSEFNFPISEDHLLKLIFKAVPDGFKGVIMDQVKSKWKLSFK